MSLIHLASACLAAAPNVLFIIVDDLGNYVEQFGGTAVTPNIGRLASAGAQFDAAYISVPVCGPSRTAFLTGMRPDTTQVWTIGPYFRTPDSLKDKVEKGEHWDVPARGEKVEVADDVAATVRDALMGAYFGLCGEIVDAGLISVADFNMGLDVGLDMKPAFSFMNEVGTDKALALVQAYAANYEGFPVPKCIEEHGKDGTPFDIPVILREDRDGVAVLTIRRPKVLNALDQDVFRELQRRFEECDADASVKGVVLTGFGKKAFVSGADVNFLAKIDSVYLGTPAPRQQSKAAGRSSSPPPARRVPSSISTTRASEDRRSIGRSRTPALIYCGRVLATPKTRIRTRCSF